MTLISLKADPPSNHPAVQMRNFYCDIYTGQNIICLEFDTLDELFEVVKHYIVPAEMISVYSYKYNPYNYGRETIFAKTLEEDSSSSVASSLPLLGKTNVESFDNYWKTRQHYYDISRAGK